MKMASVINCDPETRDAEVVIFSEDKSKFYSRVFKEKELSKLKQRVGYNFVGPELLPEGWWGLKEVNKQEEL